MKKSLTIALMFTSALALAGVCTVVLMENSELAADLGRAGIGHTMNVKKIEKLLASDALVFETAAQEGDFSVEIEGLKSYTPGHFILKSVVSEVDVHEIDKLAVLEKESVTSSLTVMRTKEGKVVVYADKSVGHADYNKIHCTGCSAIWVGTKFEESVVTARDSGSGMATGRRDVGTGLATGRRKSKTYQDQTDNDVAARGKLKGKVVTTGDSGMLSVWLEAFAEPSDKELVVVYQNMSLDNLEALQKANRVKVKFPTLGGEERSYDIAIKEQRVKLAIQGSTVTVTMAVSEAKPQSPRE